MNIFIEKSWARVRDEVAESLNTTLADIAAVAELKLSLTKQSLLPGQAKAKIGWLEKADLTGLTAAQLVERSDTLSALRRLNENPTVQNEAKRNLNEKILAARPAVAALQVAVNKSLDMRRAELVKAETIFFAGYGMPWEETSVSKSLSASQADFNDRFKTFYWGLDTVQKHPTGGHIPEFDFSLVGKLLDGGEDAELHPAIQGHVEKLLSAMTPEQVVSLHTKVSALPPVNTDVEADYVETVL